MEKDDEVLLGEGDLDNFTEEAIPLVIFNEESKEFELNEEGRTFLESLQGPIGIIAVAGMYRTGKSYLLNRMLLDRSNGFGVGPTINPCTKGVWIWGKPIQGQTPDGDPITVLVMDTEGLGALDEDSNHDVRIFSLAILLSSYFIYNSVGSIDENALQNLSLVINLTKHIQIKSSGINEDIDPEEYAKYFPTFMWIVRDFTLQLQDAEGEPITSKEYLEKALASQKGFSDMVEQKNRIRRLLKSFFTERDAVTMIRPLTNEARLQDLINIPMEELRPEFVEQIHGLRRKVLQRIKPKKLNGKCLNGAMLWNLMKSYVEAINKGAIPSIESSWAYICKNECLKAQEEAFELYRKSIYQELENGGPLFEQELKDIHSKSKQIALETFQKVAVGDVKEKFLEDLKEKIKQKYNQIKQDNEQSCEQECIMFLRQNYTEIERALKNQQYASFIDYLHDIEQFKQIFEENGPPGPQRKEILLDFCIKALMESAEFFLGHVSNEMHLQNTIAQEAIKKLQEEVKEVKNDQKDKYEQLQTKLRKMELTNAELEAKEQSSREQLAEVENDKAQLENELNSKLTTAKKTHERQMEEINLKISMADDQRKESSRQQIAAESEFDKQKALLDQKIEFLEKALEDSNKREKELSVELKNMKKDIITQNREQTQVLEKQIKDQIKQIDQMKEVIYEHENKNSELEIHTEELKNQLNDKNIIMNKDVQKSKDQELELNKKLTQLQTRYDKDCKSLKETQDNESLLTQERMKELEEQLKETQETFDMGKQTWVKDEAVLKQKIEFIQYQFEDEKKKNEEAEKTHQSMIASIQSSSRDSVIGRTEVEAKMGEMEQQYLQERKGQEDQYNQYRNQMKNDLETLKKKCNELELAKKLKDQEYTKDVGNLKDLLQESETAKEQAIRQSKTLEHGKGTALQAAEEESQMRQKDLELQIEEKDQEIDQLIQDHNEQSETKLTELKRFYDGEKERLENRINEEKTRQERKLNQTIEDYEEKVQEMSNNQEEAYNVLVEEKNATEDHLQNVINQLEKENQVMQQSIESKDKYLIELKANYTYLQEQTNKQNDMQTEKFSRERKELTEKVDHMATEIAKRERSIVSLENQKEGLMNQIRNRDQSNAESKADLVSEKQQMIQKIEDLKLKCDSTLDELSQSRIDFEREKALKDQKLTFQEQRLQEYQDNMKQTIDRYEERLKNEKEDFQKMLQEKIDRIQKEKENVETKYDQKRKALKEIEKQVQQQQSQFEREKAVQHEKYENLDREKRDIVQTYEIENQKQQEQIDELTLTLSQGEVGIKEQVEQWKSQYYDIERLYAELQSEFEKEKALWDDKFAFHQKQRDQAKKDAEENLTQFQQTIEQLQKTQNESKTKHSANHNSILSQMQEKFKQEIGQAGENASTQINELQTALKRLESENKSLTEKVQLSSKYNQSEQGGLEKRIERIIEERDRLKNDFDSYKTDREKKMDDQKRQFEREKDLLKQKNNDLQQRSKNTDSKQTDLMMAHETNRAKWDQEKSFLQTAKEDAMTELRNVQKKYENQLKEVERLKEKEKKSNWRAGAKRGGNMENNVPVFNYKLGEGIASRYGLGTLGAGAGAGGAGSVSGKELSQSQNMLNIPKTDGMSTFRSNYGMGMDKSVDNFKGAFANKFTSGLKLGTMGGNASVIEPSQTTKGAVVTPAVGSLNFGMGSRTSQLTGTDSQVSENPLDMSDRMNIVMQTPSPKGKEKEEDDQ